MEASLRSAWGFGIGHGPMARRIHCQNHDFLTATSSNRNEQEKSCFRGGFRGAFRGRFRGGFQGGSGGFRGFPDHFVMQKV